MLDVENSHIFDEIVCVEKKTLDINIFENLEKRDFEDRNRADSPLIIADDAKELDNSNISQEEQFNISLNWALEKIKE